MTYEDAYLDGFCKAAEAAGVNPVQLYKQAGVKLPRMPWQSKYPGEKLVKRYLQLLRGGNSVKLAPLNAVKGTIGIAGKIGGKVMSDKIIKADPAQVAGAKTVLKAYLARVLAKGATGLARRGAEVGFALGLPSRELVHHAGKHPILAELGAKALRPAESEIRKVIGTRLGTGAVAVGGASALSDALSGDEE